MNRPIKFRAEYEGKIYTVASIDFSNELGIQVGLLAPSGNILVVHIDNVKLMQFTGLTDKNGKEIYEGDIVRYRDGIYKVDWFENGFYLFRDVRAKFDIWWVDTEVIGNIYENPDLLTNL